MCVCVCTHILYTYIHIYVWVRQNKCIFTHWWTYVACHLNRNCYTVIQLERPYKHGPGWPSRPTTQLPITLVKLAACCSQDIPILSASCHVLWLGMAHFPLPLLSACRYSHPCSTSAPPPRSKVTPSSCELSDAFVISLVHALTPVWW